MRIDDDSRIQDVYQHPVGHDVIDKLLLQMDRSRKLVMNPIVKRLKLKTVKRLSRHIVPEDFWDAAYWLMNSEPDTPSETNRNPARSWWKEAVFYQVYPRSFCDSNGDGVGDLKGIISKLDYLQTLGVDALWLSPIYDSPNDDNGYDIRNYREIMDEMGTMADFDLLLEEAHKRGMRLIMDLVINHTSDEHEWFRQALADPTGEAGESYFLIKGTEDQPPNNWVSFFRGPAWKWYPKQEIWALHLFSDKQMDLNWDYAPLRQKVSEMVRWWLAKGVDGFRLDVINYISKREGLPDGNNMIGELMHFYGVENYYYGPNLHRYLRELRRTAFDPYEAFSVGETPGIGVEQGRLLSGEDRHELDLIFNFDHLEMPSKVRFDTYQYDLNYLKSFYQHYYSHVTDNDWLSLFLDNHDNPRFLSKVNEDPKYRGRLAKLLLAIQLTLRGTPFLFQGQELGAVNQAFDSIQDLRDVESLNLYSELVAKEGPDVAWKRVIAGTRDHARVPMRWNSDKYGGFSGTEPWLDWPEADPTWSAEEQNTDPDSVLNYTKELLKIRKEHSGLRWGKIRFIGANKKNYMAYFREEKGSRLFCEFNLSSEILKRPFTSRKYKLLLSNFGHGHKKRMDRMPVYMEPYEANIYLV